MESFGCFPLDVALLTKTKFLRRILYARQADCAGDSSPTGIILVLMISILWYAGMVKASIDAATFADARSSCGESWPAGMSNSDYITKRD